MAFGGHMKLLSVEQARAAMLRGAALLGQAAVPLDKADGRVLAEDVVAQRDQPPFDASAMDGWAVRTADLPAREGLSIIGEAAAGRGFNISVAPGEAVRIFTGAPIPPGADRVIVQETAERRGDHLFCRATDEQTWIRPRGGDFRRGDVLLEAGTRMDPWRLALAAAAGRAELRIARRPRVIVLPTGPELADAGAVAGTDQIYDSAGPAIAALAQRWGADAFRYPPLPDEEAQVVRAIGGIEVDVILAIGGASVGDHDVVRPALARLGLALRVESVATRPGKPTWFGLLPNGRRFLGLPGNPVSAMVCAELFLRPLLLALQGASCDMALQQIRLGAPLPPNGPREHWLRARMSWDEGAAVATPFGDQDSSLVSVMAGADALIRHPAGAPAAAEGELCEALPLSRG